MAMRYNTWNMGGSAGGKQMEMVDAVPGVPKVGLKCKFIVGLKLSYNYSSRAQW